MTNWSDKKLKICRYLSYWAYVFCTIGIPVLLVAWRFDIFKKPGPLQVTGWAIVLIVTLAFILGKHLKRAVDEMEQGVTKAILHNMVIVVPFLAIWIILTFLEQYISQVNFVIFWTMLGLSASAALDVWHAIILKEVKKRDKRNK
jgi:hypothetical protein